MWPYSYFFCTLLHDVELCFCFFVQFVVLYSFLFSTTCIYTYSQPFRIIVTSFLYLLGELVQPSLNFDFCRNKIIYSIFTSSYQISVQYVVQQCFNRSKYSFLWSHGHARANSISASYCPSRSVWLYSRTFIARISTGRLVNKIILL